MVVWIGILHENWLNFNRDDDEKKNFFKTEKVGFIE